MSDLLNEASLVLIPSGTKASKVYAQIPEDGSGDMTFSRASTGTRINSQGLVEVVPYNLLEYSEDFSNAVWYKSGVTVTPNDATAPNGTLTADKIVFSGANKTINQPVNIGGAISTRFVYVKGTAGETISIDDIFTSQPNITLTGDWQLIGFTLATPNGYGFGISTYGGATARTIYLWGAQLNQGSVAQPYYATTDRLNIPRLNYQNGGGGCPSLLLEAQRTNVFTYSEDFSNASWNKRSGTTISTNTTISPDGYQDADTATNSSGDGYIWKALTLSPSTSYTISLYAKGSGTIQYNAFWGTGSTSSSYFNLTSDWQRLTFTFTTSSSTSLGDFGFFVSNTAYIWGAQLEAGSYPSSYIPTLGTSVTRVADECYKTGISSLIGQTEGTIFVDFVFVGFANVAQWIQFLNGSAGNYIGFYTNSNNIVAEVSNSGAQFLDTSVAITVGTRYKLAIAYKANDFAYYVNGTQIAVDTNGTVPTCSEFNFNYNTTNANMANNLYKEVVLFPTRLTNSQLAELTA